MIKLVHIQPAGEATLRLAFSGGALILPNGFELSAMSLHRRLDEAGALIRSAA